MNQFYMRLVHWITYMNSDNLKDGDYMIKNTSFLQTRANLIIHGIKLATEIKRTLKHYLMLYEINQASMNKGQFPQIISAIEMLKAIEIEFKTKKRKIRVKRGR